MSAGPILVMAGGTGGHVYPALAVANELRARQRAVVWLGTRQGLEARVVPAAGFDMEWISVAGLRGNDLGRWIVAPFRLIRAVVDSLGIMRRLQPCVVLGMGGFASGPGGVAAFLSRRPLVIHEQNAIAGLTNRLLAGFARVVLEAFPGSFPTRVSVKTVGNPVRPEIAAIADPATRFGSRSGPLRLLVLGGSLGALALNTTVGAALALLPADARPRVRHQAGERTYDAALAAYRVAGVDAEVVPYIEDIAGSYAWADYVVCRAGALTVAELNAAGLGAVFVPYPHAVDDHQTANAAASAAAGAAIVLSDSAVSAATLCSALTELGASRSGLLERALRARGLARPGALNNIADTCLAASGAAQ